MFNCLINFLKIIVDATYRVSNDTIQIWSWGFKALKETINIRNLRKKYLKLHHIFPVEPFYDSEDEKLDTIVQNLTEENEDSLVSDIKLSQSGYYCAVTLRFINELLIFRTSTPTTTSNKNNLLARNTSLVASTVYIAMWEIFKIIKLNNDFPLQRTSFIAPWLPPYNQFRNTAIDNKFLICHSKDENLSIINVENLDKHNILINGLSRNCHIYTVSPNGKMLCAISSKDGKVTIFSVNFFFEKIHENEKRSKLLFEQVNEEAVDSPNPKKITKKINVVKKRLECIHKEVRKEFFKLNQEAKKDHNSDFYETF